MSPPQKISVASTLPSDCIIIITGYLTTNYDLHSCLLVNKFWAYCTVSILWEAPFRNTYGFIPSQKIIPTYISCLSYESKKILSKFDKYRHLFLNNIRKPLFDYPSFLKELHYDRLCNFIERSEDSEGYSYAKSVTAEICKMIAKRSATLRRFTICSQIANQDCLSDKNLILTYLPGGDGLFRNLKNFECGHQWSTQKVLLFDTMAEQCRKITHLTVKVWREDEANSLAKLVQMQNSLKSFVLLNSNNFASILIEALTSQKDTLDSVCFKDMVQNFHDTNTMLFVQLTSCNLISTRAIKALSQCSNLITLDFSCCEGVDHPVFLPLGIAYSKLATFNYSFGHTKSFNVRVPTLLLCNLFKANGNTLEHVKLFWNRPYTILDDGPVVSTIAKHCHRLKDLEIPLVTTEEIILILESCYQLKNLIIHTAKNFNGGSVLNHFATHHHHNLLNLEFRIPPYANPLFDFDEVANFMKTVLSGEYLLRRLLIAFHFCKLYDNININEVFRDLQRSYPNNITLKDDQDISVLINF